MKNHTFFNASDGKSIFVRGWIIDNPKATVQLLHGMNEHSGRYEEFAAILNRNGYNVYAADHRGHGVTAESLEKIGFIGENGFQKMVNDQLQLTKIIREKHPDTEIFIIGHSMGSFLSQRYLQVMEPGTISGTILIGSDGNKKVVKLGKYVAALFDAVTSDSRSRAMEKIVFRGFNERFEKRSRFEWLSADSKVVDAYLNDPYCGHVFPIGFYRQFLTFLEEIFKVENVERVDPKNPVLIISGQDDPVGEYGDGIKRLYKQYKENGQLDVAMKLYPHSRHEILNDYCRSDVYHDTVKWLNGHIH
ncbi:MAG: lysophospholipase [Bacillus sp. (in: firmicutes)]